MSSSWDPVSKQISAEPRTHGTRPKSVEEVLLGQEGPACLLFPAAGLSQSFTGQLPICGPAGQSHSAAGDHLGERDTGRVADPGHLESGSLGSSASN